MVPGRKPGSWKATASVMEGAFPPRWLPEIPSSDGRNQKAAAKATLTTNTAPANNERRPRRAVSTAWAQSGRSLIVACGTNTGTGGAKSTKPCPAV